MEIKFFRRPARYTLFDHKTNEKNFVRVDSSASWRETKKKQIKLPKTRNKNEQQGAKNIAEL